MVKYEWTKDQAQDGKYAAVGKHGPMHIWQTVPGSSYWQASVFVDPTTMRLSEYLYNRVEAIAWCESEDRKLMEAAMGEEMKFDWDWSDGGVRGGPVLWSARCAGHTLMWAPARGEAAVHLKAGPSLFKKCDSIDVAKEWCEVRAHEFVANGTVVVGPDESLMGPKKIDGPVGTPGFRVDAVDAAFGAGSDLAIAANQLPASHNAIVRATNLTASISHITVDTKDKQTEARLREDNASLRTCNARMETALGKARAELAEVKQALAESEAECRRMKRGKR